MASVLLFRENHDAQKRAKQSASGRRKGGVVEVMLNVSRTSEILSKSSVVAVAVIRNCLRINQSALR